MKSENEYESVNGSGTDVNTISMQRNLNPNPRVFTEDDFQTISRNSSDVDSMASMSLAIKPNITDQTRLSETSSNHHSNSPTKISRFSAGNNAKFYKSNELQGKNSEHKKENDLRVKKNNELEEIMEIAESNLIKTPNDKSDINVIKEEEPTRKFKKTRSYGEIKVKTKNNSSQDDLQGYRNSENDYQDKSSNYIEQPSNLIHNFEDFHDVNNTTMKNNESVSSFNYFNVLNGLEDSIKPLEENNSKSPKLRLNNDGVAHEKSKFGLENKEEETQNNANDNKQNNEKILQINDVDNTTSEEKKIIKIDQYIDENENKENENILEKNEELEKNDKKIDNEGPFDNNDKKIDLDDDYSKNNEVKKEPNLVEESQNQEINRNKLKSEENTQKNIENQKKEIKFDEYKHKEKNGNLLNSENENIENSFHQEIVENCSKNASLASKPL